MLYSLNGQTVQADPSGSFKTSNVAAPDLAPADFKGDDYLFLTAVKITSQETTYAFGQIPFQITPGGTFFFETGKQAFSTFTTTPPVLPESIALTTVGSPIITPVSLGGAPVPLQTMATLSDGSPPKPVTLPCEWTTYRTSNENIARVIPDQPCPPKDPCDLSDPCRPTGMLVEGISPGVAFITATNGGATSVVKITVANPGDLISTTVEGFVRRPDASPVSGATVAAKMNDGTQLISGISDATGFFSIGPVLLLDTTPSIFAEATVVTSITESGSSVLVTPIAGGITDAGIITIDIVCDTPWSTAFGPTTFEGFDIFAMAVFDDDGSGPNPPALFVGGKFSTAGGTPANNIAKWNGQAWEPLVDSVTDVDGVNEAVNGLAVLDLNDGNGPALYVAGGFVTAGGVGANKIARWDGTNWSSISGNGDGVGTSHDSASAIAAFDDGTGNGTELYVGGSFAVAGLVDSDQCLPTNGCVDTYSVAKWNPTTQAWSAVGVMGIDTGPVNALAVFDDDGPNLPLLYIGGEFWLSGNPTVWNMAKWDGVSLSGVGYEGLPGFFGKRVTSLTVFDDGSGVGTALYAGGQFINPRNFGDPDPVIVNLRNIARWDGAEWSALGSSLDDDVLGLAGLDDGVNRILYASGQFDDVDGGGPGLRRVGQWNGTAWLPLGTGIESSGTVLTIFDDGAGPALHVGGAVCVDCPGLAAARSGSGADRRKEDRSLRRSSVGEATASSGFTRLGYVAKWAESAWSVLSNGLNDEVRALTVFDDDGLGTNLPALYAGGRFTPPLGPRDDNDPPFPTNAIARFDGVKWSSLSIGLTTYDPASPPNPLPTPAEVHALSVFDEDSTGPNPPRLFAGGNFAFADGMTASDVARWDGSSWSAVGTIGGIVEALTVFDDDGAGPNPSALYAGGVFAGGISQWNTATGTWSMVGGGVTGGSVFAEAVFNSELYIGGSFSDAGGVPGTGFLARWDGSTWSAVGSGVTSAVYALTVFDDGTGPALYVGGEFLTTGGITVNRVAKWDGVAWSALGDGLGPTSASAIRVDTLFGFDDGSGPFLYAGGDFTTAPAPGGGTIPLNRLAKWNPILNEWSAVGVSSQPGSDPGGGVDGTGPVVVQALAVFDDGTNGPAIFAGGAFETAAGTPSSNIAKLGCR